MAKRQTAQRAGGRKRSAARQASGRAAKGGMRRGSGRPPSRGGAAATAYPEPEDADAYSTLAEVAARANDDEDFFRAVIEGASNVDAVLARYDLKLSRRDRAFLEKGLRTVEKVRAQFSAVGGWGRWPAIEI